MSDVDKDFDGSWKMMTSHASQELKIAIITQLEVFIVLPSANFELRNL